ncbi:hypothetical protein HGI30_20980 [Paenibacillus albicereus]|uniref:SLH domain-containing protein n=1 Tax=Paenibacillus albicereus TaxID=2726185 RepID=A0A6H2H248_9BACL|nr:S-layer homology domain-containing protein [Paenibacillus albicereus]QJC53750.1 hypothetical protein HGI30_20980 [Paenibacillus albicereus]
MNRIESFKRLASTTAAAAVLAAGMPVSPAAAAPPPFRDIASSYARAEIESLAATGIVSGYGDRIFAPSKPVTRAEFAAILARSAGLDPAPEAVSFKDIPADAWYKGSVGALVQAGLAKGTSPAAFSPAAALTREEMAVLFARALGLEQSPAAASDPGISDWADSAEWSRAPLSAAFRAGFLQGTSSNAGKPSFRPKAPAERQAVARLAYEFIHHGAQYREKLAAGPSEAPAAQPTASPSTAPAATPSPASATPAGSSPTSSPDASPVPTATPTATPDPLDRLNQGGTVEGGLTLSQSGTFGPAAGLATVDGTLTVDPGPAGEVKLRNIRAEEIIIASGASRSIELEGIESARPLLVQASRQADPVRLAFSGRIDIPQMVLYSGAIVDNASESLGPISIQAVAPSQSVSLRGTFPKPIVNQVHGARIEIASGTKAAALQLDRPATLQVQADDLPAVNVQSASSLNDLYSLLQDNAFLQKLYGYTGASFRNFQREYGRLEDKSVYTDDLASLAASTNGYLTLYYMSGGWQYPHWEELRDLVLNAIEPVLEASRIAQADIDRLRPGYADGDDERAVRHDLRLAQSGSGGSSVQWSSSRPDLVSADGSVSRTGKDELVQLRASAAWKGIVKTREFTIKLKAKAPGNGLASLLVTGESMADPGQVRLQSLAAAFASPLERVLPEARQLVYDGLVYDIRLLDEAGTELSGWSLLPAADGSSSLIFAADRSGLARTRSGPLTLEIARPGALLSRISFAAGSAVGPLRPEDPDSVHAGTDGRDFRLSWSEPSSGGMSGQLYLLPAGEPFADAVQPIALISPYLPDVWNGSQPDADSSQRKLREGSYRFYARTDAGPGISYIESAIFAPHGEEPSAMPQAGSIRTFHQPDSILLEAVGVPTGATVRIYDSPLDGGRLLGEAVAAEDTIAIGDVETVSSFLYVTFTEPGKSESSRAAVALLPLPTPPDAAKLRVLNRAGGPDAIRIDEAPPGLTVEVYGSPGDAVPLAEVASAGEEPAPLSLQLSADLDAGARAYVRYRIEKPQAVAWSGFAELVAGPGMTGLTAYGAEPGETSRLFTGTGLYPLHARLSYDDGSAVDLSGGAAWSSSDEQVIGVTAEGVLVPRASGAAIITASYEGYVAEFRAQVDLERNPALPQSLYASTSGRLDSDGRLQGVQSEQAYEDHSASSPFRMREASYLCVDYRDAVLHADLFGTTAIRLNGSVLEGAYAVSRDFRYLIVYLPDSAVAGVLEISGMRSSSGTPLSPVAVYLAAP